MVEPDRLRSDFLFHMLFAQLLPAQRLEALIEARLRHLRQIIADMEACADTTHTGGDRFVHGFGLAINRAAERHIEQHKLELLRESLLAEQGVAE